MFICDSCRTKHYTNEASLFGSYGLCEVCGHVANCSDIHSLTLEPKPRGRERAAKKLTPKRRRKGPR